MQHEKKPESKTFDPCISCKGEEVGEYDDGIICPECGTCQNCREETREGHVCDPHDPCFSCRGGVSLYEDGLICGNCGMCQDCKSDAGNMVPGHICAVRDRGGGKPTPI